MWREASQPLLEQWRADVEAVGGNADELYQGYIDALQRHNSLFE